MPSEKRKSYYKTILISSILISSVGILISFLLNIQLINQAFIDYDAALYIVIIITIRIIIVSFTAIYLFRKWFNQEEQFLSDIPFLLGLFFLILAFGKMSDLLWNLTFYYLAEDVALMFLKIRYFIIIFEVAPLIYLGFEIILFRLEYRFSKLKNKSYMNKIRIILIIIIVGLESTAIIISPTLKILGLVLPIILIPSLIGIVYIFYLAQKGKRLSVVKPKILTIGFLLYLFSNIFRPLMQNIIGENPTYIIVVELVDLIIFIVILFGLIKKN